MQVERTGDRVKLRVEDIEAEVSVEADGAAVTIGLAAGPTVFRATLPTDDAERLANAILAVIRRASRSKAGDDPT